MRPAILLSLVLGTILMFPMWKHHDVRVDSPVFAARGEAEAWVGRFEAGEGAACLDRSREKTFIEQGYGGWFVQYRCNTEHAYWRVALGYAVPAIVVLVLGAVLSKPADERKRKRR